MNAQRLRFIADAIALERAAGHGGGPRLPEGGPAPNGAAYRRAGIPVHFFGDDGFAADPEPAAPVPRFPITVQNGFAYGHLDEKGVLRGATSENADVDTSTPADRMGHHAGLAVGALALALGIGAYCARAVIEHKVETIVWALTGAVWVPILLGWLPH